MGNLIVSNLNDKLLAQLIESWKRLPRAKKTPRDLIMLTCYLDTKAMRRMVSKAKGLVPLRSVTLVFDYAEALRIGPRRLLKRLKRTQNELGADVEFTWHAVHLRGQLAHAKAYALVGRRRSGAVKNGSLLVTSGNLTKPGLGIKEKGKAKGNFELGIETNELDALGVFDDLVKGLAKDHSTDLTQLAVADDEHMKRYALLAYGRYFHKWSLQLKNECAVRFALSRAGSAEISAGELELLGLQVDRKSASKHFLDFTGMPRRGVHPNLFKNFGVESPLGWWIPQSVAEKIKNYTTSGWEEFREWFVGMTSDDDLDAHASGIRDTEEKLRAGGFLAHGHDAVGDHLATRWCKRIREVRDSAESSDSRLLRFYEGVFQMELPFDVTRRKEIKDVYDALIETVQQSKAQNWSKKCVARFHESTEPTLLEFELDESASHGLRVMYGDGE